jgi:hypothetical protein
MKAFRLALLIVLIADTTAVADPSVAVAPENWIGKTVIGVLLAIAGYFGKTLHNWLKTKKEAKRNAKSEMEKLAALLKESGTLFTDQNYKARRLMRRLEIRLGNEVPAHLGFDETFYRLFSRFEPEERELHGLIRSTTMNSLRRVNSLMGEWLDRNLDFRRSDKSSPDREELAIELEELRLHLNQWQDKYAAHMEDQRRCLVYLDDEKKHGAGFPKNLEPVLRRVLATI